MTAKTPKNTYTFTAPGTTIPIVRVLRGDGGPKVDSGWAKWEVIDRPKRKGVTQYTGLDPVRLSVPILFDGWKAKQHVQHEIDALMRMQREVQGEPPTIRINSGISGGLPYFVQTTKFVIETIDWGDDQIWANAPNGALLRFRQDAIIHLLEHIATTDIQVGPHGDASSPTRGRGDKKSGAKHARHTVKPGETLTGIAVAEYGDRNKWKLIAQRNDIKDPRNIKANQVLVLP